MEAEQLQPPEEMQALNPVVYPHYSQNHPPTVNPLQDPSYSTVWRLEQLYVSKDWLGWFSANWQLSIYISVFYLITIFTLQIYMKERQPFKLKRALFIWNVLLATFSFFGALRTAPELIWILTSGGGWWGAVCSRNHHHQGTAFWGLLFTLSKAFELGDTIFIVLRKQPLIFLHWYHHITVLGYTWYTYSSYDSTSRWFMVMNYSVHTLMYTYYGLKSLNFRIPRPVAMVITFLQLFQMIVGLVLNLYSLKYNSICQVQPKHIHLALGMYATYFALFFQFFVNVYYAKGKAARAAAKAENAKKVE